MSTDYVFMTLFRSDNPYSSVSLSMARELAGRNRTLYVNHPYTLKDIALGWRRDPALRRRLWRILSGRNAYETLREQGKEIWVATPPPVLPVNWLPPGAIYRFFHQINQAIVLRALRKALRRYGIGPRFVYINCYDPFYLGSIPKRLGARIRIYHCIDEISQDPYTARHGVALEQEAMRDADHTLCTSRGLYALCRPHARRLSLFHNAADIGLFSRALTERFERPEELTGRQGPVVGFTGNLDPLRIDYDLLTRTARTHPDKTFLIVGPINSPQVRESGLQALPNVVLTGARPIAHLPALLQHMDCVLLPFLCNRLTACIYPLKINEYLAAGKSVISTAFSEDIRTFAHCIYLAETADDFVRLIDAAIADGSEEAKLRRAAAARGNSWADRIAQLEQIVAQHDEQV